MDIVLNIVGIAGVGLVLAAYFLLQKGRLTPQMRAYPLMNIAGSLMILASLAVDWNLPSCIIQCCWIAISLYGMARNKRVEVRVKG